MPAGLGAAGVIAGGALGGSAIAASSAKDINQQQIAAQQQNEAYMTQMSDTAYQRQVADMEAAGLNPMLAASHAGGASTPTPQMPTLTNPGESFAQSLGSAAKAIAIDIPQMESTLKVNSSTADLQDQKSKTEQVQQQAIQQQTKADVNLKNANAQLANANAAATLSTLPAKQDVGAIAQSLAPAIGTIGSLAASGWNKIGNTLSALGSAFSNMWDDKPTSTPKATVPYGGLSSSKSVSSNLKPVPAGMPWYMSK